MVSPFRISVKPGVKNIREENKLKKAEDNDELDNNNEPECPPRPHGAKAVPVKGDYVGESVHGTLVFPFHKKL